MISNGQSSISRILIIVSWEKAHFFSLLRFETENNDFQTSRLTLHSLRSLQSYLNDRVPIDYQETASVFHVINELTLARMNGVRSNSFQCMLSISIPFYILDLLPFACLEKTCKLNVIRDFHAKLAHRDSIKA